MTVAKSIAKADSLFEKAELAAFGKAPNDAELMVTTYLDAVKAESDPMRNKIQFIEQSASLEPLFREAASQVMVSALRTKDAEYFRNIADAIERYGTPVADGLRFQLIARISALEKFPGELSTKYDAQTWRAKLGETTTPLEHFRKVASELGIKFKEGKPGRPKKNNASK